jgi:ribosomal protein S18 acetylase RimI-like enzyme
MLEPMRRDHVVAVADLHREALPGLLSALGPAAVRATYEGYLAGPRGVGFVDVERGALAGFVVGSDAPRLWRRDALEANRRAILLGIAAGLLTRPRALPYVLSLVLPSGAFDPDGPELTYIAVAPRARRGGVATRLFTAFAGTVRARGARAFELSVEEENPSAATFYEARGMRRVRVYRQFGRAYRRYRLELAPS